MKAHARFVHTAPRKVRLVLDTIRGLPASEAEQRLGFMPKQAARDVYATLHSAIANAKDKGVAIESLTISKALCDEGPRIKRRILGSRGRANPISKQMSHITIELKSAAFQPKKSKTPEKLIAKRSDSAPKKEVQHGA